MFQVFTKLADLIVIHLFQMNMNDEFAKSLHFFIEDTSKIMVLVIVMIYSIAILRASLNMDVVREHLQGKSKFFGFSAASIFGAITPFCSCSSIPMFLGFTAAKIPTGVTLSFLITSPLINEVAVVLLGTLLGWKFTITYVAAGLTVGIFGGFLFDQLKSEKYLQPLAENALNAKVQIPSGATASKLGFIDRHQFAKQETTEIFRRIWKWIIIGVGVGAALHGFIPENWIAQHLGDGSWWSVPIAVIMGIPLYSNASGMIPVVETLLAKGLPVGTALALMMSTVGASFPEFILLKQVLKPKLLLWLFGYFLISFSLIGWLINALF